MGLVDIGFTFANVGSLSFKNFCVIFQLETVHLHRSLKSEITMIENFWYFPRPRPIGNLCRMADLRFGNFSTGILWGMQILIFSIIYLFLRKHWNDSCKHILFYWQADLALWKSAHIWSERYLNWDSADFFEVVQVLVHLPSHPLTASLPMSEIFYF